MKISALGVVARNTAFSFKGRSVTASEIARELGVSHILEGSVRKAGGRVRINAQLVDGASGDHVWADRYDRDLNDIFAIQDEISLAIVGALKLKLLPQEKKAVEQRGTSSAEAYGLYLLARRYWITGNFGDVRREERVMRICSRAVQLDPYYGQAWALLAFAQSTLRYCFGCEVDDGFAAAHADIVALGDERKFVRRKTLKANKVALISGGGSGHAAEPANAHGVPARPARDPGTRSSRW